MLRYLHTAIRVWVPNNPKIEGWEELSAESIASCTEADSTSQSRDLGVVYVDFTEM
jgi:hypothetical protein